MNVGLILKSIVNKEYKRLKSVRFSGPNYSIFPLHEIPTKNYPDNLSS